MNEHHYYFSKRHQSHWLILQPHHNQPLIYKMFTLSGFVAVCPKRLTQSSIKENKEFDPNLWRSRYHFVPQSIMPLIIISGLPSSGKTTRAKGILNYFNDRFNRERRTNRIHLINDESLGISKDSYQGMSVIIYEV